MKFAKYQDNNLVPEWRKKYLDYKKGKKLLKEIKKRKPRSPHISSYAPTPRTPHDGHEADTEDGHSGHMSPIYGAIGKPAMRERSSSRHRSENVPLGEVSGPGVSVDPAQQSVSGSEDSTTPIIGYKARDGTRGRRATSIKRGIDAAQVNIRQVIDQLRQRSRKDSDNASFESATTQAELNEQENTFLHWLDDEIKKIDDFYQAKEHDAEERYRVMSAQLEALRNLRNRQRHAEQAKASGIETHTAQGGNQEQAPQYTDPESQARREGSSTWVAPIRRLRASLDVISSANPGADHERRASSHPDLIPHPIETTTGYVEYRVARRRLKQAMLEFYRGMELLKSYRLMNRTGIQKIMKKFDKTTGRRMSDEIAEKVKSTHFDHSDNLQNVMDRTEDLFARYFEHNNRKNAVERLRSRDKPNEHIPSVFNDGFLLGLAIPFFIEGMVAARDPVKTVSMPQAGYLLQVWGGFFLVILFLLLFGINCWVWYHTKINYTFVFEFDTRHHLDHRQYMELPALLLFLGSFFFWLTFQNFWPDSLDGIWYPMIYLCVVVGLFLFPFHTLHRSSRAWFAIANFRILCSGLYPIEFRDFFLGDQYNSLMYSFANFPLFFCLYAKDWDPNSMATCNSSHSRVLGFFTTLPPIWRFLQCLRRFHDTRNVFPHLANAGKYSATILMYVFLSLWRIDDLADYKALFILFAAINTIYCSFWDIFMDWSLMQPHAPHPFLRSDLGYAYPIVYYLAIIIDPIMRSSWLFYVIFPGQNQHSAATSFFIGLGEVFRRFIWNFFRVENEHMTNVDHFRAARDVPLPFSLTPTTGAGTLEAQPPVVPPGRQGSIAARTMGTMKRGMVRMTSALRVRHAEDFSRRPVGAEKGPWKGRLPDNETDISSDDNAPVQKDLGLQAQDQSAAANQTLAGLSEEE